MPAAAAITSGTDTSIDAKTQSDDAPEHVASSEKVALSMIESTASSKTVALIAVVILSRGVAVAEPNA